MADKFLKIGTDGLPTENEALVTSAGAGDAGKIVALDSAGRLDTSLMITHRAPLNDIMTGYDIFANQKEGCIKWVVTPFETDKAISRDVF